VRGDCEQPGVVVVGDGESFFDMGDHQIEPIMEMFFFYWVG
jgi:hypothetical protein